MSCTVMSQRSKALVEGSSVVLLEWSRFALAEWEHASCSSVLVVSDGAGLDTEKSLHVLCHRQGVPEPIPQHKFSEWSAGSVTKIVRH